MYCYVLTLCSEGKENNLRSIVRYVAVLRCVLVIVIVGAVCTLPQIAFAKPDFVAVFAKAYPLKGGGKISTAGCALCHAGGPPKLNPYGKDIQTALNTAHKRTLDGDILKAVESKDSDGDGAPNEGEIKSDTLPGVADSKPAGTPASTAAPKTAEAAPNPFALESFVKPKHGNHPVLVHFPIALFLIGFLFDVIGIKKRQPVLLTAGYYNLLVAAISSLPTIATGLLAWQWQFGGAPLESFLLYHLICGIVTSLLLFTLLGMRRKAQANPESGLSAGYWVLAALTLIMVMVTGHIGGFLAYG